MKPSKEVIRCLKLQYFGDFQYFILMSRILDCKPELYPAKKLRFFFLRSSAGFLKNRGGGIFCQEKQELKISSNCYGDIFRELRDIEFRRI